MKSAIATPALPIPALISITSSTAKKFSAATLATIHNERFIVRLVDQMRAAIIRGDFAEFKRCNFSVDINTVVLTLISSAGRSQFKMRERKSHRRIGT
jgi:hypothetical protein